MARPAEVSHDHPMTLRQAGERARLAAPSDDVRRLGGLLAATAILALVYMMVRATGGTPNPLVHLAYFGIIVAAVAVGARGGALAGLAAGLLLGPLMPDSTAASATILAQWGWFVRLAVYVVAGLLVAGAWHWAGRVGRIEVWRRRVREVINVAAQEPTSLAACHRLLGELSRWRPTLAATIYVFEPDGSVFLLAGWSVPGIEIQGRQEYTGTAAEDLRRQASGPPHRRAFPPEAIEGGTQITDRGGRSVVVVPLQVEGAPVGVLYAIGSAEPGPLGPEEFLGFVELAEGAAALVRRAQHEEHAATRRAVDLVRRVLADPETLTPAFQPILSISGGGVAGYEALARFAGDPPEPPDIWFARAATAGLGAQLQALAITRARRLAVEARLPLGSFLTINVSPRLLANDLIRAALSGDLTGLVIELTEEEAIADADYEPLRRVMAEYRVWGARFAVDDAGAGYASMRHVTELRPDFVKLDARLIVGLSQDDGRQALVRAMQTFSSDIGAVLIAEGVETVDELALLAGTGLPILAQGYAIARPGAPWPAVSLAARRLRTPHPVEAARRRFAPRTAASPGRS